MGTNTTHYEYAIPADGDDVGGPQIGDISQGLEDLALAVAEALLIEGFLSATDLNPTAVPGVKEVQVSTGGVLVLSAGSKPILRTLRTAITLTGADGIVGGGSAGVGIANYFFAYANPGDSLLHWHIDQDNTAPSGGKLAFTAMVDPTSVVSVNSRPTGRVNIPENSTRSKVAISAGAEASNARQVSIQLQSLGGVNIPDIRRVEVWLSDTDRGGEAASAPSGGVAFNTGTMMQALTANKRWLALTNAGGLLQFTVTEATAKTFWVVVLMGERLYSFSLVFA